MNRSERSQDIARKLTKIVIILYAIIKFSLSFLTHSSNPYFMVTRAVACAIMVAMVLIVTRAKISNRATVILTALSAVLPEILWVALVSNGEWLIYIFLIGCSLLGMLYLDIPGLLVSMLISCGALAILSFGLGLHLAPGGQALFDDIFGFVGIILINFIIILICRHSIGAYAQFQRMGQTFNAILETTPDFVAVVNDEAKVDHISRSLAENLGISHVKYAENLPFIDLFPNLEMKELFSDFIRHEGYLEATFKAGSGAETRHFMLRSANTSVSGIARVFEWTDVTPLVEARDAAEEANKSKSHFLATMSHEIRTPMNAILGVSEIELEREGISPEAAEALYKIYNSGHMLMGIINDIIDLSKLETGKFELVPTEYETASMINDAIQLNIMRIGSKPIDFVLSVSEHLPTKLFGDELRIKQVLNNLLSNAFKYTDEGRVTLEISAEKGKRADEGGESEEVALIITVRDTGQGMTRDQLTRLYDNYSRFNMITNRSTEGVGLGMSITKSLIEMMGGTIKVDSAPGIGSVFAVRLMQKPAGSGELGRELAENLEKFRFSGESQAKRAQVIREYMPYGSVLIVDDIDANLFVAKGLISPYGIAVETATSGFEALDKVRAGNDYDIIFMDHMMPQMDGIETTQLIREIGYLEPIVALTANAITGQAAVFLEKGFDDFISKPIDIRQLNAVLNKLIRDKQPQEVIEAARMQKSAAENTVGGAVQSMFGTDGEIGDAADDPIAPLRGVDGLDIEPAVAAMGGMHDVYMDTVRLTARLLPETITKMDGYLAAGDIPSFTVEIHGMKSVLKNIGATSLSIGAAQLETDALGGSVEEGSYSAFRDSLDAFSKELIAAIPAKEESAQPIDAAELKSAVENAKAAAEGFDSILALEILSPFTSIGGDMGSLIEEIIHALEAFDCETAASMLRSFNGEKPQ